MPGISEILNTSIFLNLKKGMRMVMQAPYFALKKFVTPFIRIFDIAGKQVYNKPGNTVTGKINNHYKLDLHNLPGGTYMLEVHNGMEVNQVKFVLLKK